ncbi:phage holin family protein [Thermoproteota archaeon]
MSKEESRESHKGFIDSIIETMLTRPLNKVMSGLEVRMQNFITDQITRITKKIMLMMAGAIMALLGILFIFGSFALYLNEFLQSTWMGWTIVGIIIALIGVVIIALGRR